MPHRSSRSSDNSAQGSPDGDGVIERKENTLQQLIRSSANAAAVLGMLCCAAAAFSRLSGAYHVLGGPEVISVFTLGIGLMVFACLAKLELLLQREEG